jgi:hypothetical protein
MLHAAADPAAPEYAAVRKLLKGPEVPLPESLCVRGGGGYRMRDLRVRWWDVGTDRTYRSACIHRHEIPPAVAIPAEFHAELEPLLPPDGSPLFVGHYWLPPGRPAPLRPNIACLDYSVAIGGPLVAYRWDGERRLDAKKYVYDPARLPASAALVPV